MKNHNRLQDFIHRTEKQDDKNYNSSLRTQKKRNSEFLMDVKKIDTISNRDARSNFLYNCKEGSKPTIIVDTKQSYDPRIFCSTKHSTVDFDQCSKISPYKPFSTRTGKNASIDLSKSRLSESLFKRTTSNSTEKDPMKFGVKEDYLKRNYLSITANTYSNNIGESNRISNSELHSRYRPVRPRGTKNSLSNYKVKMAMYATVTKKRFKDQFKKNDTIVKKLQKLTTVSNKKQDITSKIHTTFKDRIQRLYSGNSALPHRRGSWKIAEDEHKKRLHKKVRKEKIIEDIETKKRLAE